MLIQCLSLIIMNKMAEQTGEVCGNIVDRVGNVEHGSKQVGNKMQGNRCN